MLQRSELVALVNTLHRLVESLHMVQDFRKMWAETGAEEEKRLVEAAEAAAAKVPKVSDDRFARVPSTVLTQVAAA